MRLFRTKLHAYVVLVVLACLVIAGVVMLLLPREETLLRLDGSSER